MFASGDVRIARAALAEAVGRIELGPGDELADLRQTDIGCDRKDGRAEAPSLYRTVLETNHERTYPMDELKVVNRSLHLLVLLYLLEVDTIIGKQYAQYGGEEPYWQLKQLEQLIISHEIEVELKPTFTKTPTVEQVESAAKKLRLQFYTVLDVLQAIGQSCVLLEDLYIFNLLEVDTIIGKQYAQYGGEEPYWQLKQLEQLIISHEIEVELKPTFTKTPTVEQVESAAKKLRLQFYTVLDVLQAIGQSCVLLEDLYIFNVAECSGNPLRFTTPLSFANIKLPRLENFTVGSVAVNWPAFADLHALKYLKIEMPCRTPRATETFASLVLKLHEPVAAVEWLIDHKLLQAVQLCRKCEQPMRLRKNVKETKDCCKWVCTGLN
uniref:Uncharacterized protein n=1 Tax=Anopheles coluzzii TaxID=1518534 RepID=A0A8W7PKZ7_ANOCL